MLRIKCNGYKHCFSCILINDSKNTYFVTYKLDKIPYSFRNLLTDDYYISQNEIQNLTTRIRIPINYNADIDKYTYEKRGNYLYRIPKTIKQLLCDNPYLRASTRAAYLLLKRSVIVDIAQYIIKMWIYYLVSDDDSFLLKW